MGANPLKTQKEIVKRLETEGPLSTSAFRKKGRKRESWWGWTPEKTALEYSWRTGLLAVRGREGFEKVYDLAERVIPPAPRQPNREETLAWSCRQALQRLGLATTTELANFWYFFRSAELSQWCEDSLPSVSVDGQKYWVRPDFAEISSNEVGEYPMFVGEGAVNATKEATTVTPEAKEYVIDWLKDSYGVTIE